MNFVLYVAVGIGMFMLGVFFGVAWSHQWTTRFRYEAQHWYAAVQEWQKAYYASVANARELRNDIVALHHRITKLTVENCEVMEWAGRAAKRALEANAKLPMSSTPLSSQPVVAVDFVRQESSQRQEKGPTT